MQGVITQYFTLLLFLGVRKIVCFFALSILNRIYAHTDIDS